VFNLQFIFRNLKTEQKTMEKPQLTIVTIIFYFLSFQLNAQKLVSRPDTVFIHSQCDRLKTWSKADMFQNEISPLVETENTNGKLEIDIRAFKHQFDKSIPKTWVLGYANSDLPINKGLESLPGPFIETKYGKKLKIKWNNKLKETIIDNNEYPIFNLVDPFVAKKCGGGPTCKCGLYEGKFYPIIYNVKDTNKVNMVQDALYSADMGGMDMPASLESSSYYSTTVHLHGANVSWGNDGYPNSKFMVTAGDLNKKPVFEENISWGLIGPNEKQRRNQYSRVYRYPNTFPEGRLNSKDRKDSLGRHGGILWYHDHSMMRTASNVYAGLVGAYIIEGFDEEKVLAETQIDAIPDIPLLLSDKSFTSDGFLYYNTTQHISGEGGQPEFYGKTIVVNGKVWPKMKVGKGLYRFRLLNTSSSRFYNLGLFYKDKNSLFKKLPDSLNTVLKSIFIQIGTEGGLMPTHRTIITKGADVGGEKSHAYLTLAPGERVDVLINFSELSDDIDNVVLGNFAPNGPYQYDEIIPFEKIANPLDTTETYNTNYVMQFKIDQSIKTVNQKYNVKFVANKELIKQLVSFDNSVEKQKMISNIIPDKEDDQTYRKYNQKENASEIVACKDTFSLELREAATYSDFPKSYRNFLERIKMDSTKMAFPMVLMNGGDWNSEAYGYYDTLATRKTDAIKTIKNLKEEIWAIHNVTDDTHPIHLHLNRFQVIGRKYDSDSNKPNKKESRENTEYGWKDVVRAKPHCTTYIKVQFILNEKESKDGQFVYHCHILEHEDMSMMRRLIVKK
jgi:FtsP/CotA-like multicopper oxidase with cupredoxin domain